MKDITMKTEPIDEQHHIQCLNGTSIQYPQKLETRSEPVRELTEYVTVTSQMSRNRPCSDLLTTGELNVKCEVIDQSVGDAEIEQESATPGTSHLNTEAQSIKTEEKDVFPGGPFPVMIIKVVKEPRTKSDISNPHVMLNDDEMTQTQCEEMSDMSEDLVEVFSSDCFTAQRESYVVERTRKCEICGFSTTSNDCLLAHVRRHLADKVYKCSICDYKSVQKYGLTTHMKTHRERQYKCSLCDYSSIQKRGLTHHMRNHTGERPYKCSVCDYSSISQQGLTDHMKTHTAERPYRCSRCDYSSIRKSGLTSHMKHHTRERPYKCSVCDYSSLSKQGVTNHMKTHTHKNDNSRVHDVALSLPGKVASQIT